jgi:hypothetical protein
MHHMTDCRHGFPEGECGDCADAVVRPSRSSSTGRAEGHAFALVYAPTFCEDTFLHLNRQGDRWKFRRYTSPDQPAEVLAQSAPSSNSGIADLGSIEWFHEIDYPHSRKPAGVTVEDSRYWFDAIERANAQYAEEIPALRKGWCPGPPRTASPDALSGAQATATIVRILRATSRTAASMTRPSSSRYRSRRISSITEETRGSPRCRSGT